MEMLGIEYIEQAEVCLDPNGAEGDVHPFTLLTPKASVVVIYQKALIIDHPGQLKLNGSRGGYHNVWLGDKGHVLLHTMLHLGEHIWDLAHALLK
jgi:hypothetical protein